MHGTVCIGDAINWGSSLNRGLVSWWVALPDQQRGNVFRDLCMRHHGTLTGGAESRGKGVLFTSTGQYVHCGTAGPWAASQSALTVEATCKTDTDSDSAAFEGRRYISSAISDASGIGQYMLYLRPAAGLIYFELYDGSYYRASASVSVAIGRSYHVIGTYLAGSGIQVYVRDNAGAYSTGTASGPVTAASASSTELRIGGSAESTDRQWLGHIYSTRYDTRYCSEAEAAKRYAEYRQGYPTTLNWTRPRAYVEQGGGGGTSILRQMLQQGLFCGGAT